MVKRKASERKVGANKSRPKPLTTDELLKAVDRSFESREARSPLTEAMRILFWSLPKAFADPTEERFAEAVRHIADEIYGPMLSDTAFTESALVEWIDGAYAKKQHIDVTEEVAAYCALAVKAWSGGNENLAWTFVADAQYWMGVVAVTARRGNLPPARLLANMRHVKTHREREKIASYWREKIDRRMSAQKAATEILKAEISNFSHKKIAEIVSALRRGEPVR